MDIKLKYRAWVGELYPQYSSELTDSDIEKFAIEFAEYLISKEKKYNLLELTEMKNILEKKINQKESWVNAERGHNYEEYRKRLLSYLNDENHKKLKEINQQIEFIINSI